MNDTIHSRNALAVRKVLFFGSVVTVILGASVLVTAFALAVSGHHHLSKHFILHGATASITGVVSTLVIALGLRAEDDERVVNEKGRWLSEQM
jgi:hypothetical protein